MEQVEDNEKTAKRVVTRILKEFDRRGGWDHFWNSIDGKTQRSIQSSLEKAVLDELKRSKT